MSKRNNKETRKIGNREFKLGHYLIVTDGERTEHNYFNGMKEHLPNNIRYNITIDTVTAKTKELVRKAIDIRNRKPNINNTWIVFDKDRIEEKLFNRILKQAKNNNINAAWSNPCIEIWFLAYFGICRDFIDSNNIAASDQCINELENKINNYIKNDKEIYAKLIKHGNEETAIKTAKEKHRFWNGKDNINMTGTTTVYKLVEEIKSKISS